jgi:hypothetical protein
MLSVHEQLTEQFYKWEARGRGWQVFEEPVYLEPPFVPFHGHYLPEAPAVDDGRKSTLLSSIFRKISQNTPPSVIAEVEEEPEPKPLVRDSLVEFQTSLPADLDIGKEAFEQFLRNLALCREPVAFELIGITGRVSVQFVAGQHDAPQVRRQLQSYFPEATFQPKGDNLQQAWESCEGDEMLVYEFGLAREFMLPLASGKLDPFIGMVGALSELSRGDIGLFQVIFQPVQEPWAENILRSVTNDEGKPFFVNQPELAGAAENKIQHPLYAAVVRIAAKSNTHERALQIACDMAGSLRVFAQPQGNELIPLENDEKYPDDEHIEDVIRRQSRRSGMLLNSGELIGFVHLPSSAVRSPALARDSGKTKAAPAIVRNPTGLFLGNNVHFDESIPVRLTKEQRLRHTHIIGATGTGKSTLLFNLIRQDIENGEGVGVLDPSGDLIERILGIIPESRIKDVILVNPYDTDYPIAFNILQAQNEDEKNILASDLVSMFRRFSELGVQMDVVLRNAILAIMNSSTGGTLADLHNFLIDDDDFRKRFLTTVKDESVLNFWQKVFPRLPGGKSIGSVLIRLHTFLDQKPFRLMVTQRENRLNFADIMDSGKIFLAKLPEGLMGAEDSYLLGTLLVSKFQQTAMARQARPESDRPDFWLYIDEFDNFITPSMAMILSKTRKYHLGLTLAHHNLQQLQADAKVASAVMTNPATRIVFKVGGDDAKKLAEGFTFFEAQDFRNLEKGHAICSVERSDFDFNLSVPLPDEINEAEAAKCREKIIAASRARYGTPRAKEEDSSASTPAPVVPHVSETPKSSEVPKPAEVSVAMPEPTLPVTETESVAEEADTDLENEQHTNIKNEIRDEAETLEYTVSPNEVDFPEVHARADIFMVRGSKRIVGQVTVTNRAKYEVESIRKFLKAGLTHIAVISINRKKLNLIQQTLEKGGGKTDTVGYYSPSEFITQLYTWASVDPAGGAIESVKPQRRQEPQNSVQLSREQLEQRHKDALEKLRKTMRGE